ncbi:MAG: cytochrome c [Vicingaceae bacterium]
MKGKKHLIFISFVLAAVTTAFRHQTRVNYSPDNNVWDVLIELGEEKPDHYVGSLDKVLVERGKDLVFKGSAIGPDGKMGGVISKFYDCIDCHNTVREDVNLAVVNPDARLELAIEKEIPYLQASTFWGIVNRESWYNDDYVLKYGDLVEEATGDLKKSAALCATVCSQGTGLNEWEMEALLAYYWSLQLKLADLNLSQEEYGKLNSASVNKQGLRAMIKSKYLQKSPATFAEPPLDSEAGFVGIEGRPEKGMAIFALSCKYCHRKNGPSNEIFEDDVKTYRWLERKINSKARDSFYALLRHGTFPETGHRSYMPHFTLEKMSDQQIEDLRAYIEEKAK